VLASPSFCGVLGVSTLGAGFQSSSLF
jgi:hypothetical protein